MSVERERLRCPTAKRKIKELTMIWKRKQEKTVKRGQDFRVMYDQ